MVFFGHFSFFFEMFKKVNVGVWGRSTNRGWARLEKHNIQMGMVVFEKKIIFLNVFSIFFSLFGYPLTQGSGIYAIRQDIPPCN